MSEFDVAVLDQWGVLHDGTTPYPHAIGATKMLTDHGKQMTVVSNSGKRSAFNRAAHAANWPANGATLAKL